VKKFIGLIVTVITIIISIIVLKGTGRYIGSVVGIIVGAITSILLYGFAAQKYKGTIIAAILVAVTGAVLLFFIVTTGYFFLIDLHDFFTIEHSLDLQPHGSYTIDTSGIKKYMETKENESFTYFLQLGTGDEKMDVYRRNHALKEYGVELPDELLGDIAASDEYSYIVLSFGSELKEVKYKYLGYFSDGVTSKAKITFCEDYQDNVVYAYFMKKRVYFWEAAFYAMEGSEKVFLDESLLLY